MNEENFVSKEEMAKILDCSEKTIDRLRKQGMPAYNWAGKIKFVKSEVLEWIKENKKA